jgi:hypothetical protein
MPGRNACLLSGLGKSVHPDPWLLLQQAEALLAGQPDETDLRRAISAAYYAVFHCVLRYVADTTAGVGNRGTHLYRWVYRSVQHEQLRTLCHRLGGPKPDVKIMRYAPAGDFGPIVNFAPLALNLQDQREYADYDPVHSFNHTEVQQVVSNARTAVQYFQAATPEQRGAFLSLLLIKPGKRDKAPD